MALLAATCSKIGQPQAVQTVNNLLVGGGVQIAATPTGNIQLSGGTTQVIKGGILQQLGGANFISGGQMLQVNPQQAAQGTPSILFFLYLF